MKDQKGFLKLAKMTLCQLILHKIQQVFADQNQYEMLKEDKGRCGHNDSVKSL